MSPVTHSPLEQVILCCRVRDHLQIGLKMEGTATNTKCHTLLQLARARECLGRCNLDLLCNRHASLPLGVLAQRGKFAAGRTLGQVASRTEGETILRCEASAMSRLARDGTPGRRACHALRS